MPSGRGARGHSSSASPPERQERVGGTDNGAYRGEEGGGKASGGYDGKSVMSEEDEDDGVARVLSDSDSDERDAVATGQAAGRRQGPTGGNSSWQQQQQRGGSEPTRVGGQRFSLLNKSPQTSRTALEKHQGQGQWQGQGQGYAGAHTPEEEDSSDSYHVTAAGTITYNDEGGFMRTDMTDDDVSSMTNSSDDSDEIDSEGESGDASGSKGKNELRLMTRTLSPPSSFGQLLCAVPEMKEVRKFPAPTADGASPSSARQLWKLQSDEIRPQFGDTMGGDSGGGQLSAGSVAPKSTDSLILGNPTGAWARGEPERVTFKPLDDNDNFSPWPSAPNSLSHMDVPQQGTLPDLPITLSGGVTQPGLQLHTQHGKAPLIRAAINRPFDQQPPQPQKDVVAMSPWPSTTSLRGAGGGTDAMLGPPGPTLSGLIHGSGSPSTTSPPPPPQHQQQQQQQQQEYLQQQQQQQQQKSKNGKRDVERSKDTLNAPALKPDEMPEGNVSPLNQRELKPKFVDPIQGKRTAVRDGSAIYQDGRPDPRKFGIDQTGPAGVLGRAADVLRASGAAGSDVGEVENGSETRRVGEMALEMKGKLSSPREGASSPMFRMGKMTSFDRDAGSPSRTMRGDEEEGDVPLMSSNIDHDEMRVMKTRYIEMMAELEEPAEGGSMRQQQQQQQQQDQQPISHSPPSMVPAVPPRQREKDKITGEGGGQKARDGGGAEEVAKGVRQVKFEEQGVADLVALLGSHSHDEILSAVAEIDKICKTEDGRAAVVGVPRSASVIASVLGRGVGPVGSRHAVKALASLSMDARGRRAITGVGGELEELCGIMRGQDRQSVQYSSLLIGNLAMDREGRGRVLASAPMLQGLTALLWSEDVKTVRHTVGALRNVSSDTAGRRKVEQDRSAVRQIQALTAHSDTNTARYAGAVMRNLEAKHSSSHGPKFTL